MQILFAISIFSFLVLVIAGIAIVRHIRESHTKVKNSPGMQHDFSQHFLHAVSDPALQAPQMYRQQSVQEITAKKLRDAHSKLVEISPTGERRPVFERRKPPQATRPGVEERLDWAYFNKDYGDLRDPYPSRRFRARPDAKSTSNRRA
jgi:hypothetical protein